jgi:hypothetical protein
MVGESIYLTYPGVTDARCRAETFR